MTDAKPRLVLHIGAMKTGTTYLQSRLHANRQALREQGWWVPNKMRTGIAVRDSFGDLGELSDLGEQGEPDLAGSTRASPWRDLLDEGRARGGRGTIVTMEFLSFARRAQVPRILAPTEGFDVEVVLTVRDAVRALPSQWQTLVRNRQDYSWPEFAKGVREARKVRRGPGAKQFRRTQDVPRMVRTWAESVPPDRLTAITVPRPGQPRGLLYERFLSHLDVDPPTVPAEAAFDNPQLGYGSSELMRMLNAAGLNNEDADRYREVIRRITIDHVHDLRAGQSKPRLDRATARFAVRLNANTRRAVSNLATLVGDPEDLPARLDDHPVLSELDEGPLPAQAPDAEILRAGNVMLRAAAESCRTRGLDLPAQLIQPLPQDVPSAVRQVATALSVAMTGDPTHVPIPRRALLSNDEV